MSSYRAVWAQAFRQGALIVHPDDTLHKRPAVVSWRQIQDCARPEGPAIPRLSRTGEI
jgi:hypothetical protein